MSEQITTPEEIIEETNASPIDNVTPEEIIGNVATEALAVEEPLAEEASVEEEPVKSASAFPLCETKEEVIARLKILAEQSEEAERSELESLKQIFYKIQKAEQEVARKEFIEANGEEAEYKPEVSPLETEYKALMQILREKRAEAAAQLEGLREENLQKKLAIIDQIKNMVESNDDVNKAYDNFKALQHQWNEIKQVPQAKVNELWKSYQLYVEQFYDLIKINKEFRDYDFKKNLELKTKLCEAAEKLTEETDVVSAFHQLQKMHQEYRVIGPVAKELREDLWLRFKEASTTINRRHQEYFEKLKAAEQENLDKKTVICEIVEAFEYDTLKNFTDWETKTQEVIALQAKWKTIGFAPQKMNMKVFERFRAACDDFFHHKAEFFKEAKSRMTENLAKKNALCEQAEALKESTDWKETTDILMKLQKDWKEIGPVQKKFSEPVWRRFIAACDYFFEQKNKVTSVQRGAEQENLAKKREIIARLEALDTDLEGAEAVERIKAIVKEFNEVGHVPFREKDKLYMKFRALVDKEFERLHVNANNRRLNNFRNQVSNRSNSRFDSKESPLQRERRDLMHQYDVLKNEIQTYENNLGFLSASSKSGNSLVTDIKRKVEKLKGDLNLVVQKIKVIDDANNVSSEA
ncbi:MAG: DUF349 domain-containing protein [Bacteroidaceae bacterium]|nr:DUF349 domain-containing protein [Bacteroidaceae bacterium]